MKYKSLKLEGTLQAVGEGQSPFHSTKHSCNPWTELVKLLLEQPSLLHRCKAVLAALAIERQLAQ